MTTADLYDYIVKPGECLASIAARLERTMESLWDLPENSELKQKRADPYVLAPGDVVRVPKVPGVGFEVRAGERHVFQRRATHIDFELAVSLDDEPRANLGFSLFVDGAQTPITGKTDAAGVVRVRIPAKARRGVLEFEDGRCRLQLHLGELDPFDTVAGVQGRLRALGHYFGELDGELGPYTTRAIRHFQRKAGLPTSGSIDAATTAAIRTAYGR